MLLPGLDLLFYSGSFMLGILSFSVFITFFYTRKGNILVAVWIHFLFNVFMQIVILEDLKFMFIVSLLYLLASGLIVALNKDLFLKIESREN